MLLLRIWLRKFRKVIRKKEEVKMKEKGEERILLNRHRKDEEAKGRQK